MTPKQTAAACRRAAFQPMPVYPFSLSGWVLGETFDAVLPYCEPGGLGTLGGLHNPGNIRWFLLIMAEVLTPEAPGEAIKDMLNQGCLGVPE